MQTKIICDVISTIVCGMTEHKPVAEIVKHLTSILPKDEVNVQDVIDHLVAISCKHEAAMTSQR